MPDDRSNDNRPSPDALLEHAEREERGRLRIFLGAAPGVGKTYEMLMAGRARLADGVDVVIGIVETHGRKETLALVEGYQVIPRQKVDYKGRVLDEMDIDAILARRPALGARRRAAHTNAPGSRHPKRYLDVQEILTRGIDVYTTLNIQHVESLNDVVAQITRVRCARNGSRFHHRPGRRRRDHRPHPRRPDQAARGRQGLFPQHRPARHRELLLTGQSDGASRIGAAAHRPAR